MEIAKMKMMRSIVASVQVIAFLGVFFCATARADQVNFDFTGASDFGSGILTLSAVPSTTDEYLITGITGTTNGSSITGLISVNDYPYFPPFNTNDNLFYDPASTVDPNATSGYLDGFGVSYMLADGTYINLFYGIYNDSKEVYNIYLGTDHTGSIAGDYDLSSFTVTTAKVTPEPSSLVLFFTGLFGMVAIARKHRRGSRLQFGSNTR